MTVDVKIRKNILWSGENPIILLQDSPEAKETTAVGFFRVDYSPAGSGHAVFVISDDLKVKNSKMGEVRMENKQKEWARGYNIFNSGRLGRLEPTPYAIIKILTNNVNYNVLVHIIEIQDWT